MALSVKTDFQRGPHIKTIITSKIWSILYTNNKLRKTAVTKYKHKFRATQMWNAIIQLKRDKYLNILTIKTTTTKFNEQSEEVVTFESKLNSN